MCPAAARGRQQRRDHVRIPLHPIGSSFGLPGTAPCRGRPRFPHPKWSPTAPHCCWALRQGSASRRRTHCEPLQQGRGGTRNAGGSGLHLPDSVVAQRCQNKPHSIPMPSLHTCVALPDAVQLLPQVTRHLGGAEGRPSAAAQRLAARICRKQAVHSEGAAAWCRGRGRHGTAAWRVGWVAVPAADGTGMRRHCSPCGGGGPHSSQGLGVAAEEGSALRVGRAVLRCPPSAGRRGRRMRQGVISAGPAAAA